MEKVDLNGICMWNYFLETIFWCNIFGACIFYHFMEPSVDLFGGKSE